MNEGKIIYDLETETWGLFYNALLIASYEDFLTIREKMLAEVAMREGSAV